MKRIVKSVKKIMGIKVKINKTDTMLKVSENALMKAQGVEKEELYKQYLHDKVCHLPGMTVITIISDLGLDLMSYNLESTVQDIINGLDENEPKKKSMFDFFK
jgi:hypothetical protein